MALDPTNGCRHCGTIDQTHMDNCPSRRRELPGAGPRPIGAVSYAQSTTGLFHIMPNVNSTKCGEPIGATQDRPAFQVVPNAVAADWLAAHPWDLCQRCR